MEAAQSDSRYGTREIDSSHSRNTSSVKCNLAALITHALDSAGKNEVIGGAPEPSLVASSESKQ
jgi:hypothetical protein